jgi:uncharacterized protein YcfJ
MQKTIAIAVASLFTAVAAPAAFADHLSNPDPRSTNSYDSNTSNGSARWDRDSRDSRDARGSRDRDARVIESRPLYAEGSAKEECWNEHAGHYEELREPHTTRVGKGAAIGAVAGGVVGHQVDHGTGTAVGAVLGGLIGHQVQKRNERDDQPDLDRSRCRVIADNGARPMGYDVKYEYDGREYVTRLDRDPGNTLRVGRDTRDDGSPRDDINQYR